MTIRTTKNSMMEKITAGRSEINAPSCVLSVRLTGHTKAARTPSATPYFHTIHEGFSPVSGELQPLRY